MHKLIELYLEREALKGHKPATLSGKKHYLVPFVKALTVPVTAVSGNDVRGHVDSLVERGASTYLIRKTLMHLQAFYEFLREEGLVLVNPVARVEKPAAEDPLREVFSEDEVKRIFAVIPDTFIGRRDRALLELLYSSGLRACEAAALCVDDIDFVRREIAVYHGKGGKERMVPVGRRALEYLEIYIEKRLKKWAVNHDLVFVDRKGGGLKVTDICKRIKKYTALAGMKITGSAHAFRRSCATHLLAHGVPLQLIGRLLGHTTIETTRRYVMVGVNQLRQVHQRSFKEDSDGIISI